MWSQTFREAGEADADSVLSATPSLERIYMKGVFNRKHLIFS